MPVACGCLLLMVFPCFKSIYFLPLFRNCDIATPRESSFQRMSSKKYETVPTLDLDADGEEREDVVRDGDVETTISGRSKMKSKSTWLIIALTLVFCVLLVILAFVIVYAYPAYNPTKR